MGTPNAGSNKGFTTAMAREAAMRQRYPADLFLPSLQQEGLEPPHGKSHKGALVCPTVPETARIWRVDPPLRIRTLRAEGRRTSSAVSALALVNLALAAYNAGQVRSKNTVVSAYADNQKLMFKVQLPALNRRPKF